MVIYMLTGLKRCVGGATMDYETFEVWLGGIRLLNAEQRQKCLAALALTKTETEENEGRAAPSCNCAEPKQLTAPGAESVDKITAFKSQAVEETRAPLVSTAALDRIEHTGCPHCRSRNLRPWGNASGLRRYRCGDCRRTFNGLTGSPLARLRKKELWVEQADALITAVSVAKAAERFDVAHTTAFRWRHRFLSAPSIDKPKQLNGIVEADETFILESFKGQRSNLPRPARKRGGKAAKPGLSAEQIPVLVARDRAGATTDAVLPKLNRASVTTALSGIVTPENQLCCDGGKAIVGFARNEQIPCCILPAPGGPRPEAPNLHINNINAYHGRLKEWLIPFHGVSTKYLGNYLGWRRAVEALGAKAQPLDWLRGAVGIGPYQQLTLS